MTRPMVRRFLAAAAAWALAGDATADATVARDLVVEQTANAVSAAGLLRIAGAFKQADDGRVVIEAEEPTRFVSQDEKNPLRTFPSVRADGVRAVAYLKRGWYEIAVTRPARLVLWYRAYIPSVGHWNHTEQLDAMPLVQVVDSNTADAADPNLSRWVWKRGAAYEFSPGIHTFALDWQGGAQLDQLAFLSEGMEPTLDAALPPTFGATARMGTATTAEFTLLPGQVAKRLRYAVEPANGHVAARFSADGGQTWTALPEDGSLTAEGARLRFQLILMSAAARASPTVHGLSLEIQKPGDTVRLDDATRARLWRDSSLELVPAHWTGLRPGPSGWALARPAQPDETGTIWLDAVQADQLILAPKQESWVVDDPDAVTGRAVYQGVLNRNLISFDVSIPAAQLYTPWFRVRLARPNLERTGDLGDRSPYFPSVTYQFDRQTLSQVECAGVSNFPGQGFLRQEWVWLPGVAAPVEAGEHTFRVRAGLDYAALDRIALVPHDAPTPTGRGGQSPRATATTGEIVFQPLDFLKMEDIPSPAIAGDINGGSFSYSIAPDDGRLRAIVRPDPDGRSPRIESWHIGRDADESQAIALTNAEQTILFDAATGTLVGWRAAEAGWIIPAGGRQPLFAFAIGAGSEALIRSVPKAGDLISQTVETAPDYTALAQEYQMAGGNVRVSVRIELPRQGLSRWSIEIHNGSGLEIRNVEFPTLAGIRVGRDPEQLNTVAVCNSSTADMPGAPFGVVGGRPLASWYPGWYSMGWLAHYGPQGTFTAQVRDQDGVGTLITPDKDPLSTAMQCGFNRRIRIGPNERGGGRYELGWHRGDWHRAADLYSAWAHSWMDFSRVNSNWTRDADGWVAGWHYASGAPAARYMTHLAPEMEWLGANYFQHFGSSMDGWWSQCYFPLLNPRYGTLEEFRAAHAQSRRRGVYHTYYMGSRGWTDAFDDSPFIHATPRSLLPAEVEYPPKGFGARWGARDQSGNLQPWGYTGGPDMMLCPASPAGQDHQVRGIARHYGELAGADGVYSDEACGYTECYATDHEHDSRHGLWTSPQGLQAAYRRTLEIARPRNADFSIAVEGCPDQLLQYADFGLYVFTPYCDGAPFLYTFPEAKLLRGAANPDGIWCRSREEYTRFISLFLRYDTVIGGNSRPFFAHRKRIKDWMYRGRFMDDVDLTVSRPGVIAKWFRRDTATHQGALVNIQNEGAISNATVRIEWPGLKAARSAFAYLLDEEELVTVELRREGDAVIVAVPPAQASSLLIPASFTEKEAIRAFALWPQEQGADRLVVALANISSTDRDILLAYELPAGVTLRDAPGQVKAPAGQVTRLEIFMDGLASLPARSPVRVRVRDREHEQALACIVGAPLDNAGFETDSAGQGTPDGWRTMGHYWFTHLLQQPEIPLNLHHADGVMDPANPAEGHYALRLDGAVTLPNYWPVRCNPALRNDPAYQPPPRPWHFNTAHEVLLKPGARYRVSFQHRQASDDGFLEVRSTPYGEEYATVPAVFPPQRAQAPQGSRDWQKHSFEFTAPSDHRRVDLGFINHSTQPAWIDAVNVQVIEPANDGPSP